MKPKHILWCAVAVLALVSCKEEDNTQEEYPNWQATNNTYFNSLVADARAKISAGDAAWLLLPSYSLPTEKLGETAVELAYSDYVVVEKIASAPDYETLSPFTSDTVEVHYVGKLLPSTSYKAGYVFDKSYPGDVFDPVTAKPYKVAVNKLVNGFATAVVNMHRGDRWKVYIPYQLGYGSSLSSVPAYSTLIFDVRLEDFWSKKRDDRL